MNQVRVGRVTACMSCALLLALSGCDQKVAKAKGPNEPAAAGMRSTTQSQRMTARKGQALTAAGLAVDVAGVDPSTVALSPLNPNLPPAAMAAPNSQPDVFGVPNYANTSFLQTYGSGASGLAVLTGDAVSAVTLVTGGARYSAKPTVTLVGGGGAGAQVEAVVDTTAGSATYLQVTGYTVIAGGAGYTSAPQVRVEGQPVPGTGVRKFVDALPGLTAANANGLGQHLPLAVPFTAAEKAAKGVPNDGAYYELEVSDYLQKLHTDLPATPLRGYADRNPAAGAGGLVHQYLGPVIVAFRDQPVRVKFTNAVGTGAAGELTIPVDRSYMGAGNGPDGTPYADSRATLHLHGGNSPWISDGTPHQWTAPAGEVTNFKKGLSTRDVPDMAATTAGEMTFFWTNQQSGRLMFYHDHSYGITRLNVYAGEAAGFLLVDPAEEHELAAATIPGTLEGLAPDAGVGAVTDLAHVLPLVIQDKTFVPDDGEAGGQLAATDPTWDLKGGRAGKGSLWFPHVYTPNQNPADLSGANAFGRWDYGPWFWPPQNPNTFVASGRPYECASAAYPAGGPQPAYPPLVCPGTPNPSGTPEAFMDTPVVNGTVYPKQHVERAAYRFQMLTAANDRSWNFSLFYAATKDGVVCDAAKNAGKFKLEDCTEVAMVPAVPHLPLCSAGTTANCLCTAAASPAGCTQPKVGDLPLCDVATATTQDGVGLATSTLDATGVPVNGTGLPAGCWPTTWPTDGREGGVPDPTTAGPALNQIGTEGGLLPKVVSIPATPVNYEYNRRSITVLNVSTHGLLLGAAERADVVVDFTGVADGSALILYNDSPAPIPGIDPRIDYYTNDPDNSPTGGAPSTPAGYGPNTRTVLKFEVSGAATNAAFNFATAAAALPAIFAKTQDPIIVPQTSYPITNGGAATDTYVRIQDTQVSYFNNGVISGINVISPGANYNLPPTVTIDPPACAAGPGCVQATAQALLASGVASPIAWSNAPFPGMYWDVPTVTFTNNPADTTGAGATAVASLAPTHVWFVTISPPTNARFTSAPTLVIAPPFLGGLEQTVPVPYNAVNGTISTFVVVPQVGPGLYTRPPEVKVTGGGVFLVNASAVLYPTPVAGITVIDPGAGYTLAPTAVVSAPLWGTAPSVKPALGPAAVAAIKLVAPNFGGHGYGAAPKVTITAAVGGTGSGAEALAVGETYQLQPKAIQELFTLDYGRMNATLGVEVPFTNFFTQTTIPYGYVDPPTELVKEGQIQFWKITHNGVDTHFLHFHLFTVQVINRVGWDGAIKPPDANELSWKDTVRMNPLEDIIVALRPYKQTLPWQLPNSVRPLDVTQPVGSNLPNQFAGVDPSNNPAPVQNALTNFGHEYVWHCHILGHEENDMMRAISFVVPPEAPADVAAKKLPAALRRPVISWTDKSITETGFTVQRARLDPATGTYGAWVNVATRGQNQQSWQEPANLANGTYRYQVVANNVVGYTATAGYPSMSGDTVSVNQATVSIP